MKRTLLAILPAAILLLAPGCGDDGPSIVGPPPLPTYPPLSTPQNVLFALGLAYETRDSTVYVSCFDPAYQGVSYDVDNAPGFQPGVFAYADEAAHIGGLKRTSTILGVDVNFGPIANWVRADGSSPGWAQIIISNPRIFIADGFDSWETGNGATFQFEFAPTPDGASPTDTTWKIVRWVEAP